MTTDGRRHLVAAGVLWAVLTVIGEWAVYATDLLPTLASRQGEEVDRAFELLLVYSVPVMAVVLAVLFYSVARWRVDEPTEDGPALHEHRGLSRTWFIISVSLAALLFIHPGLTGFLALAQEEEPDLVIALEGVQWHWNVSIPERDIAMENPSELLLPVDTTIRFDLTSRDVIHAFWIPAFRLKQDAIPGETNSVTVTPVELGSYEEDGAFRLQCAELCGTGHARMYLPVRVVSPEEFEAWLAGASGGMAGMDMSGEDGMDMSGDQGMNDGGGDGMNMSDDGNNG